MTVIPKLIPIMKITISATVRGQTTAAVSTDDLSTVQTADTAVMNMPATLCPMAHGHPPVHPCTSGQFPVPVVTVPPKRQAII